MRLPEDIYYFVAGPHPHDLCLRGSRRSALLLATIRLVSALGGQALSPRQVAAESQLQVGCRVDTAQARAATRRAQAAGVGPRRD